MKSGYVTLKYTGPVGKKGHTSFCWLYRNVWLWGVGWGQGGGTVIRWYLRPLPLLYTLMKAYLQTPNFLPYIFSEFHAIRIQHSLRSKRFRSSYCAKVEVREGRGGEGKRRNLFFSPSPFIPPFCPRPNFVEEHAQKRLLRRLFSTRARFPVAKTLYYAETFSLPNKTGHDS